MRKKWATFGGVFYNFLEDMKKEAVKSDYVVKLAAAIFNKNKFVCMGHNKTKQHPILLKKYKLYSTHAECDVILKSKNEGNILIVVRVRRQDGKFTMAKPCKKCMSFIKDSGIKKIWFTNWNGELEFLKV